MTSRSPFRGLLVLVLLALWMAPGASALVLSIHVALNHHGSGGDGHHGALSEELARATAHGHHHTGAVPDHEHLATREGAPGLHPGANSVAILPPADPEWRHLHAGDEPARPPRRAPPAPLFYAHCSLLL